MTNIFSNKIKSGHPQPDINAAVPSAPDKAIEEADIKSYKDVSGLNLKQVRFGLWIIENKPIFIKAFYAFLILISAVTWPIFIYTFGSYIFLGMNEDQKLLDELTAVNINLHDYSAPVKAQKLIMGNVEILSLADNKSDIVLKIKNPNTKYWAEFTYYFQAGDQKYGHESNFILPGEEKYLMALSQEITGGAANLQFIMVEISWRMINPHDYPDWQKFSREHLNIMFTDKVYTPAQATILSEKLSMNQLSFTIANKTAYNYAQISFPVVLLNGSRVVGANKYVAQNLRSGQSRNISLSWPGRLGTVSEILIIPEVNITRKDIYLQFEGNSKSNFSEVEVE